MQNNLFRFLTFAFIFCSPFYAAAQPWVSKNYEIDSQKDIIYGTAVNFAGRTDTLKLDVYLPANDTVPECGRPLFMAIHGGGWYAGHKGEGVMKSMAEDFARRGYVAVSINYRLGLFNTHQNVHCNIPGWDCWNMADTAEWYRANYRGIVDAQAALVYLSANADTYKINPENVFVAGESAGGFIALGLGFIDNHEEILHSLTDSIAAVRPPNQIYESTCIQSNHLAESIQAMDTLRPSLDELQTNREMLPYKIKGVGNFYGGAFNNIFESHSENSPALYLFHQPCDLLVPYNYGKILKDFSSCLQQFPANCAAIINRPYIFGSNGIKNLIEEMNSNGILTVEYMFSSTNNNYGCFEQLDPAMACHAIDNYAMRTTEMATFFSSLIDTCMSVSILNRVASKEIKLWPNPVKSTLTISSTLSMSRADIHIYDTAGRLQMALLNFKSGEMINVSKLSSGIYFIQIFDNSEFGVLKFVKE